MRRCGYSCAKACLECRCCHQAKLSGQPKGSLRLMCLGLRITDDCNRIRITIDSNVRVYIVFSWFIVDCTDHDWLHPCSVFVDRHEEMYIWLSDTFRDILLEVGLNLEVDIIKTLFLEKFIGQSRTDTMSMAAPDILQELTEDELPCVHGQTTGMLHVTNFWHYYLWHDLCISNIFEAANLK